MNGRDPGYTLELIAAGCSVLACYTERGWVKLEGVSLQMGFEAGQHAHDTVCNLLFGLPGRAADSLLLPRPKLGSHGAAYCVHAVSSCLSDVRSPLLSFLDRLLAIVARRFIFISEFIDTPVKALADFLLPCKPERRADASFGVLQRGLS